MCGLDNIMHEANHAMLFKYCSLKKWMTYLLAAFPIFTSYTTYCNPHEVTSFIFIFWRRDMLAFIHGFLLAIGLILPLGVQNVFIFNQGATHSKFIRCLPAVLTATICDALLIILAVTGVSVIVMATPIIKNLLITLGICFLLYMGLITWKSQSEEQSNDLNQKILTAKKQILFASSVSLLNPHAILDTIGVIGTSSIQYQNTDKWLFAIAGILVSLFWFTLLAVAGGTLKKLKPGILPLVNKISALVIWGSASYLIYSII